MILGVDNHEQAVARPIDFHIGDARLVDRADDLDRRLAGAVPAFIVGDQIVIVDAVERHADSAGHAPLRPALVPPPSLTCSVPVVLAVSSVVWSWADLPLPSAPPP